MTDPAAEHPAHAQQAHPGDRLDVDALRNDTPGCAHVLHFNNAGASLMPRRVLDVHRAYLEREATIGGYEAADEAHDALEAVYDSVAALLNAHRDEIALVDSATRAWDLAFYGIRFRPGDRILTHRAAYASNYIAFLHRAADVGIEIDVVPSEPTGEISLDALRDRLDDRVRLIALTHVPTNGGLVNPAAEVGRIAREAGVLYLLDACQSAGQLPLDVEALGCDFLSSTGRKYLRGPRGTGFLYVRRAALDRLDPLFLDMHAAAWTAPGRFEIRADARRFETWERPFGALLALGAAVDYARVVGVDAASHRIAFLAETLRGRLAGLPGITVHDAGRVRGGLVTFSAATADADTLQQKLRRRDINVSVSVPSSTLLDAEARHLPEMIRASVHYFNTEEEIERFCKLLPSLMT